MARRFTTEVLAQIPLWVAENLSPAEIAARIGCSVSSLKVTCSNHGISLRRPKPPKLPGKRGRPRNDEKKLPAFELITNKIVELDKLTIDGLRLRAAELGTNHADLISNLLVVIVRDNLFSAVLDI